MFQIRAKLLYNNRVKGNYWHCFLDVPRIANQAVAGQFVMTQVSGQNELLLRRPFSIHSTSHKSQVTSHKSSIRIPGNAIEILYEVVGKNTEMLSQKEAGEYLDIIGPLGNGFKLSPLSPILVAGGMGVAPLLFLAETLVGGRRSAVHGRPLVLIGAKTKNHLLCEKEFKQLGCQVKIATDDGSRGFKGKVTELLRNLLPTPDSRLPTIYACGPKPMLEAVTRLSRKYNIPAQISLEEHMVCGFGACLGCVVQTHAGYKRVCKDGPVFNADEIV